MEDSDRIKEISLEMLRTKMGTDSNRIISEILEWEKQANLWITQEIEEMIKWHILTFLQQKAAIAYEYKTWDKNGDAYLFENRETYRKNIEQVKIFVQKKQTAVTKKDDQVQITTENLGNIMINNNTQTKSDEQKETK